MKINCPGCNREYTLPESAAGKEAKCKCGEKFRLPYLADLATQEQPPTKPTKPFADDNLFDLLVAPLKEIESWFSQAPEWLHTQLSRFQDSVKIPPAAQTVQRPTEKEATSPATEIVYILTNESFWGLIKIGRTTYSVRERMKQLNTTGVPEPYKCYYAAYVDDAKKVERTLHKRFAVKRKSRQREFFELDPAIAKRELLKYARGDATNS